jgi:D-threonate/D-erythronate kinase
VLSRQTETAASVLPRGSGSVALALPGIVVADAETAAELAAVARRVVDGGLLHAVSGSAGLAGELSRILIRGKRTANAAVRSTRTLVFFGSPHPVAVEQLETARLHFGLTVHRPTVSRRSIRISSAVEEAEFDLLNGGLAVVGAPLPDERVSLSPESVALGLARTALRVMDRTTVDAIVVSGGDIAAAICATLGVERIVLTGQFYPGAPLGRIQGGAANGAWLVTKSGAHGDARGLVTILSALRGPPGGELPCDSVEKETSVL